MKQTVQWTAEQIDKLRQHYPTTRTADLADDLQIPLDRVYSKATRMGLRKNDTFLATTASGRIHRGGLLGVQTQFHSAQTPWNAGLKGFDAGGRSAETRFKPGSKPHTTMPVGSYRINKDGHLQRKIGEASGANHKRWRNVAELLWIEANGPLPAGHIVIFRPGMRTAVLEEITLDRIECISRADNARRNHPANKSPELARLVQLKGAITRQVNRIAREAEERKAP